MQNQDQNVKYHHASNIAHLLKSKNSKRRTISYMDFRISEESEEDNSQNDACDTKGFAVTPSTLDVGEERGR